MFLKLTHRTFGPFLSPSDFFLLSALPPTCSLNSLPDEVILQILSGLSLPEVQCTVARVATVSTR